MLLNLRRDIRCVNWLIIILSSLSAFAIPLIKFNDAFITRDWTVYNSFSYFTKSSWLHYKTLPLHNPYVFGGFDILANPQSKVFSPLSLFDLIFSAPFASLFSLITLSILGSYGMFRLLIFLNVTRKVSLISTVLFAHASWFSLHFSEGHIVFGSFQLIGLVLYFALNLNKPKFKIYLSALLAFMILDGGIYTFIYSILLIVFSFIFRINGLSIAIVLKSFAQQKWNSLMALFIFVGLASAKLIPLLSLYSNRTPIIENIQLNTLSILHAFFNPYQHIHLEIESASYMEYGLRFHEVGTYIGILSVFIVGFLLIKNYQKKHLPYLLILFFFLWIGTGFGQHFNPWKIFQKLPIINNAHIQTRALFLVYFTFIILLSFALDYIIKVSKKGIFNILAIFLLLEALSVSSVSYYKLYKTSDSLSDSKVFSGIMENTRVEKTLASPGKGWGNDYQIFSEKNTACKTFMDNVLTRGEIKSIDQENYNGEAYFLSGNGSIEVLSYTPNGLEVNVNCTEQCEIQFNTNHLLNWTASNKNIDVYDKNGLLTLKTKSINENVTLKYSPKYLVFIIPLYLLALALFLIVLIRPKTIAITD